MNENIRIEIDATMLYEFLQPQRVAAMRDVKQGVLPKISRGASTFARVTSFRLSPHHGPVGSNSK